MKRNDLQGGDYDLDLSFYKKAFDYIKDGSSVLNLGSGRQFNFEKELLKNKKVSIASVDIIKVDEKPEFLEDFFVRSVEDELKFEKKFDVVTFFELIEHIDKTDELLKNCFNNLNDDGRLVFSFPNLSSIFCRIELMLGFQPHVLEVSNEMGIIGTGFFGKINSTRSFRKAFHTKSGDIRGSLHHIRGITSRAMKEMVEYHGFKVEKIIGTTASKFSIFNFFPSLSPVNIFVCTKKRK